MISSTSVCVWIITLLSVLKLGSCQRTEVRPKDVWDVEVWGGLPPFSIENTNQDLIVIQSQNLALDLPSISPAAVQLPNPCTDIGFRPPVYEFSSWNITKTYLNASGEYPSHYTLNVSLQDTANNFSMGCSSDLLVPWQLNQDWRTECVTEKEARDDRFQSVTWLRVRLRVLEVQETWLWGNALGLQQYWYCPPGANESRYPREYQAGSSADFNASCPLRESANVAYACTVATAPSIKAAYTPKWLPNQTEPLIAHPLEAALEERSDPAPVRDCTDMSLTHPDWVVEDGAIYVPNLPGANVTTSTLNFTIMSRPTGVRYFCFFGGNNTKIVNTGFEYLQLLCRQPPGSAPDPTRTWLGASFRPANRQLSVSQTWICGDTGGNYFRKYRAETTYVMPLFCADDSGRVCRANRHVVKGIFMDPLYYYTPTTIPPPPGANRPGCTAGSTIPSWIISNFRFEETRYRRVTGRQPGPPQIPWPRPSRLLTLELRNSAIDYFQSCTITLPDTDQSNTQPVTSWLRCFPNTGIAQRYIATYIEFNTTSAELHINQTWYCADTDPSKPLLYQGLAIIKASFCGESNSTITDACQAYGCRDYFSTRWCAIGTYNSHTGLVTPYNKTISGTILHTNLLPSNALTDPDPDPSEWSCTADSIGKPVLWILSPAPSRESYPPPSSTQDFLTTTPYYDTTFRSTFSVLLRSSALTRRPAGPVSGFEVGATAEQMTPYMNTWKPKFRYGLEASPNEIYSRRRPFRNVVDWSFRFDAMSGYLELNHSWFCNDKNPGEPILFNGTWAGYVDMDCKWNGTTATVGCEFGSGAKEVAVRPRVTWTLLSGMQGLPNDFWYPYG